MKRLVSLSIILLTGITLFAAEVSQQEAMEKALVGQLTEAEWNETVNTAWEIDGQIRSAVWTEQYHAFTDPK